MILGPANNCQNTKLCLKMIQLKHSYSPRVKKFQIKASKLKSCKISDVNLPTSLHSSILPDLL